MIETLILVCSLALTPAECTPETARAVIQGPTMTICAGHLPQAYLAATAVRPVRGEEYLRTVCRRARS